jgi:hypothetical protein
VAAEGLVEQKGLKEGGYSLAAPPPRVAETAGVA